MKDVYIVKKSVKKNPLKPSKIIDQFDFKNLVNNSNKLTWLEDTKFGKKIYERYTDKKKEIIAFLNYEENKEEECAQLQMSQGYIWVQLGNKSQKEKLHSLIDLSNVIDSNLWQFNTKRQILTHEIVDNKYKRTKPRAENQKTINLPHNWIYIEGSLEKFQIINRIKFDKIKSTIARINNGRLNNSIIVIEIEPDKFFILGKGIKLLINPTSENENDFEILKSKYAKRLSKLFDKVQFRDFTDIEMRINFESTIVKYLKEVVSNKEEILIVKLRERLF